MKILAAASSAVALLTLTAPAQAQCPSIGPPQPEKLTVPSSGLLGIQLKGNDQLGRAVDISGDTAVVGSWLQDLFVAGDNVGAAYVYERVNGCWELKEKLVIPNGNESATAVAVDGDRILVSNWKEIDPQLTIPGPGAVYVFEKDQSGCWGVTAKLAPDPGQSDSFSFFGVSLDLEGDRALIGCREDNEVGGDEGAAYIFEYDSVSDTWSQTQKLLPPPTASVLPSWFGNSVSLSGDSAIIGSWVTTCEPPPAACSLCFAFNCGETCDCDSGTAFVYDLSPTTSTWTLSATLTASDASPGDGYGTVSMSGDVAVVGAYEADAGCPGNPFDCNSGAAYVYERDQFGNWIETAKLVPADAEALDNFGYTVAVENDTIVVGARFWDGLTADSGTAYVFRKQNGVWTEISNLVPVGAKAGSRASLSLGLSEDGRYAILGAPQDNGETLSTGAAYVLGTTLTSDLPLASLSNGDVVNLNMYAGPEQANRLYVMLGSLTGTCPGLPLDDEYLPLNILDPYFVYSLANLNTPPLTNSFGSLGSNGEGTVTLTIPAGSNPNLSGLVFHHAFVALDTITIPGAAIIDFASNAVATALVP